MSTWIRQTVQQTVSLGKGAFVLLLVAAVLAGCGGSRSRASAGEGRSAATPTASPAVAELSLGTDGENMKFDKTEFTVRAGQEVQLTFHNSATTLQHNWVLVNGGDDVAEQVDQAAVAAGFDKGFIPDSDLILAHTRLLNGGEEETITFTAPSQPGDYTFLCTFPGHFQAGMKGVLHVQG
ncbi:plastocyanin/azurin family copper-binding protein [Litorilinea aerophila]|uniref:Auracyanin n=1 Tax=Litorilinea aerophila TaxID=1204385 RepID=A0A540V904_9CHLR|nr:plastocyanin/azurin family copper-binding protein [Litorilinea aerophila]MCC9078834.1 plastocyanin/azurin family copper-binding protein [Litorilinea aerophila]